MYLGFQGLRALAQILPAPAVRWVGGALGLAAYGLLWDQRRLTLQHLELALGPELSAAQRRRVARRVFINLSRNVLEWLRLPSVSLREIERIVRAEGIEHLRTALAQGNGAILIGPHFGNWELIPLYLKSVGFDGGVLARRLRYPEYESFIISLRGQKGIPTFAKGSVKEVARLLRENQLVGMLPDQDTDSLDGVFVNFFGRPAYTPVGPAALSLMTRAPIIPCFIIREGAGFRFIIEPPVALPAGTDRAAALLQLTQAWTAVFERCIRRYPDHWVWMHRRWKTQPPVAAARPPAVQPQAAPSASPSQPMRSVIALVLLGLLAGSAVGCAKRSAKTPPADPADAGDQQMTEFMLTGYQQDGSKQWELKGRGAVADGPIVTIHRPDAIGYDAERTGYLTASTAQVQQATRRVRLEHDVTIHTSDGLWLSTPILHWLPDQNHMETDEAVRIETDHMLLRGRRMTGSPQLKQATIFSDIELVLNPGDHEPGQTPQHVTITCDGPLAFDYERNTATFEHNVHVRDPNGDLYSDTLVAYLDPVAHTIRYAEASGHVRIHQQQNTATSERAIYEPVLGKITLAGQPSLLIYPDARSSAASMTLGGLVGAKPTAQAAPAAATAPQP